MNPNETAIHQVNDTPQAYTVKVIDKESGEVVQEYDTKIAIVFGVKDGDLKGALPVQTFWVGDGFQLAELLGLLNKAVTDYLGSLFKREAALRGTGRKKAD